MNPPFLLTRQATITRNMARRARSAERRADEAGQNYVLERLTNVLERMDRPNQLAQQAFKPPHYSGVGSVEIFIRQFIEVAEANQWPPAAALLHLRGTLEDEARDCGAGNSLDEIFAGLRARFGLTPREARARLNCLKRDSQTHLQEHATKIEELIKVAYPDMEHGLRIEMAVDQFSNSLGHAGLQRHLLAIRPRTLPEAVSAGNEFLQIKGTAAHVRQVDDEVGLESEVKVTQNIDDPSLLFKEALIGMTKQLEMLQQLLATKNKRNEQSRKKKPTVCWKCGQEGHMQRNCKTVKDQDGQQTQENLTGQQ